MAKLLIIQMDNIHLVLKSSYYKKYTSIDGRSGTSVGQVHIANFTLLVYAFRSMRAPGRLALLFFLLVILLWILSVVQSALVKMNAAYQPEQRKRTKK